MSEKTEKKLEFILTNLDKLCQKESKALKELKNSHSIIIYGAGRAFYTFLIHAAKRYNLKSKIKLIIDKNKFFNKIEGIEVISPMEFNPSSVERNTPILITVTDKKENRKIKNFLEELGCKKIYFLAEIPELLFFVHPSKNFLKDPLNYTKKQLKLIIEAYKLLKDEKSKKIFIVFLETYITKKFIKFPSDLPEDQYFPKDVPIVYKNYSHFIDVGAWIGDTLIELFRRYGEVDQVIAFEPDIKNFEKLTNLLTSLKVAKETIILPLGIGKETNIFYYSPAGPETFLSENISINYKQTNKQILPAISVALDDILLNTKVSFIKMDIEGMEKEAIEGAKKIIQTQRPVLAICVYHKFEHLYEIPVLLEKFCPNAYDFYLRTYRYFGMETVLYVVPKRV